MIGAGLMPVEGPPSAGVATGPLTAGAATGPWTAGRLTAGIGEWLLLASTMPALIARIARQSKHPNLIARVKRRLFKGLRVRQGIRCAALSQAPRDEPDHASRAIGVLRRWPRSAKLKRAALSRAAGLPELGHADADRL